MTNAQLRDRLKDIDLADLPLSTQLMLSTEDRKHPFRGTIRRKTKHEISLDTEATTVDLILRDDGSVSHVVRWPVRRGAFPQTTQLRWWKLAE